MKLDNIKKINKKTEVFSRGGNVGRPTENENGEKRDKKILSTFTATELKEILDFMNKQNEKNKSSFIRETILNYIRK